MTAPDDEIWQRAARILGWRYDTAWSGWIKYGSSGPGELDYTILPSAEDACAAEGVMSSDEAQAVVTKGDVT